MERKLYKVGLSVNFGKEVNLLDHFDKIVEASDQFNQLSKYKKVLTPSCIENDMIYFLIAFNINKTCEKFTLRSVVGFLKGICSIFNIEYNSKKKYFSLEEEYISLSEDEYISLYKEACFYISTNSKGGADDKENQHSDNEEDRAEYTAEEESSEENIKIPNRKFPVLLNGNARIGGSEKKEGIEYPTLKASLEDLNNLIGLDNVKDQIKKITSFIIRNNERCVNLAIDNPGLYYNTVISGNRGTGKNTIARILYHIYYHLGVIGKGKLIVVDSKEVWPGSTLDRHIGNAQSGVILINDAHLIPLNDRRGQKDNLATLEQWFATYKDNFVFILAGETEGVNEVIKSEKLRNYINFYMNIPDFTEKETVELIKHFADKEKYAIEEAAEGKLFEYISELKEIKLFNNAYTARAIVEKAIIKNGIFNNSNCLRKEDFFRKDIVSIDSKAKKVEVNELDPFEELEGMIGLNEVKEKVKEISAYAAAQLQRKKLGLKSEPLCLHMNFVGNPGTGKTSVARSIGKILNKLGVLSTGKFVEAAREDLVGKYVGHTAMKTADKIKEAEGGVLFIDEAYSLDSDSNVDYGHEAVNTLVKKMEDQRENLVVIFAGYPKEMSRFICMNPGLKDRIQFKLDFVDYKPKELFQIWKKFFNDREYELEEDALYEMEKITEKLYENIDRNFSNGRIIRKLFERVKMQQAVRVVNKNLTQIEDVIKITAEDIKSLYDDQDIAVMLKQMNLKKCIGFSC